MVSRRTIIASLPILAVSPIVNASQQGSVTANEIFVGPGCEFAQVTDALASITDNGKDNPYVVRVMPGIYDLKWSAKSWISVVGSGPLATIFTGSDWNRIRIPESNIHLSNFGVRYSGTIAQHAAIYRGGRATGIVLENIHIDHSGNGSAIVNIAGGTLLTWWLKGLKIRTEGTGLYLGGHVYCDDIKILLFGDNSGHPHVGCKVAGNSSRIYLNNCRIGTGYWYDYENGSFARNDVYGPDDVIGVWLLPQGINQRVEIHNLESFCRNEDNNFPTVNVNVIRAESGWVRAFGCFGQSETPSDWLSIKSLYQSGDGKIEQFACRFTRIDGDSHGSETIGVQTFTKSDDGHRMAKYEGGLHRLDASAGSFVLYLPQYQFEMPGVVHIFKKINSLNTVTIYFRGADLEGDSGPLVFQSAYETLKLTWDGNEWLSI